MKTVSKLPGYQPREWAFLRESAATVGFVAIGVVPARRVEDRVIKRFSDWLSNNGHAGLSYMERHWAQRIDPRHPEMVENAQVIVSAALPVGEGAIDNGFWTHVSRYARARDYHETMKERLRVVASSIERKFEECRFRIFIDSAPVMERSWAMSARLGHLGRNGSIIVPGVGPAVVIGEIICANTPVPESISPLEPYGLCGECTRCIDACPTGALQLSGVVDCSLCLSYWTVECKKEPTPSELRARMKTFFGCDVCTYVCPLANDSVLSSLEPPPYSGGSVLSLEEIADLDHATLAKLIKGTPLSRTGPGTLRRNARYIIEKNRKK